MPTIHMSRMKYILFLTTSQIDSPIKIPCAIYTCTIPPTTGWWFPRALLNAAWDQTLKQIPAGDAIVLPSKWHLQQQSALGKPSSRLHRQLPLNTLATTTSMRPTRYPQSELCVQVCTCLLKRCPRGTYRLSDHVQHDLHRVPAYPKCRWAQSSLR